MPFARLELLNADCAFYISKQHEAVALDYVTFVASVTRMEKARRSLTRLNMFASLAYFFASLPAYNLRFTRKKVDKNYFPYYHLT